MERLPFTQLFQHSQTPMTVRSPPLQSPTAAETYPSVNTTYHTLPHPADNMPYAVQASTSTSAARPGVSPCSVQSPPPPPYQNELLDPTGSLYINHSSSMQAASMMPVSGHPPTCRTLPTTDCPPPLLVPVIPSSDKPTSPVMTAGTPMPPGMVYIYLSFATIVCITN